MPVDLLVTLKDGTRELYYIPTSQTLGNKPVENDKLIRNDLMAWPWVNPDYMVSINHTPEEIATIEIDASMRMADVNRRNNKIELTGPFKAYEDATR
jgi:hypothetical protein